MGILIKSLRGMSLPMKKLSLLVGPLAVILLFLSSVADASPSSARHNSNQKVGKSFNRRSLPSQGSSSQQEDTSADFNSTFLGGDGKMCSVSGDDHRPGCRKLGLDMKKISLELIRQDILKKLRIDENKMPRKGNFTYDPSYLSRFVDIQGDSPPRDEYYDDEHATTEKIIAFSKPEQAIIGGKQMRNLYQFSFSDKMSNMYIESATMYIHVHHHGQHGTGGKNSNINIRISEQIQTMKGDSPHWVTYGPFKPTVLRQEGSAPGTSDYHPKRHSKWIQIDIRDSLSKWVVSNTAPSSRKITLAIEAVDNAGNLSQEVTVVNSSNQPETNNQNPFVEVRVSDAGRSRHPRNIAMTCNENSEEKRCCKYPLTVDFEEFGWDWIIAPKKYDANYCSGECPFAFLQSFPHNHIVQQANPSGIGGPCCAARKHSAISMLYFDGDSNIVFSVLPGMVVEKCGCS